MWPSTSIVLVVTTQDYMLTVVSFFSKYSNNEGSILGWEEIGFERVEAQCSGHAGIVVGILLLLQRPMPCR